MAHYAQLDDNSTVLTVVVIADSDTLDGEGNESEVVGIVFCKSLWGSDTNWKKTSYNTTANVYDSGRDAFYSPKPYPSHTLNETTCIWEAPTANPAGDNPAEGVQKYDWDESSLSWVAI